MIDSRGQNIRSYTTAELRSLLKQSYGLTARAILNELARRRAEGTL